MNKQCTTTDKSIDDENALTEDVKAVLQDLIGAVEAQIDGEKEPGSVLTIK